MRTSFEKDKTKSLKKIPKKIRKTQDKLLAELANEQLLQPIHQIRAVMLAREYSQIEYDRNIESEKNRMLQRCETNIAELEALKTSANLNLLFIKTAIRNWKDDGHSIEKHFGDTDFEDAEIADTQVDDEADKIFSKIKEGIPR